MLGRSSVLPAMSSGRARLVRLANDDDVGGDGVLHAAEQRILDLFGPVLARRRGERQLAFISWSTARSIKFGTPRSPDALKPGSASVRSFEPRSDTLTSRPSSPPGSAHDLAGRIRESGPRNHRSTPFEYFRALRASRAWFPRSRRRPPESRATPSNMARSSLSSARGEGPADLSLKAIHGIPAEPRWIRRRLTAVTRWRAINKLRETHFHTFNAIRDSNLVLNQGLCEALFAEWTVGDCAKPAISNRPDSLVHAPRPRLPGESHWQFD